MKALSKINSFIFMLVLIAGLQPAAAQQSNIDNNRMNRDINIMENVLREMFKTRWSVRGNTVSVSSGDFFMGQDYDIHGTYLPGYGIIFTIPGGPPGFVTFSDAQGKSYSYTFQYGDNKHGEEVNSETITNKIAEFLRDYGSTIGQLGDNDKVMVIYKANSPNQNGWPFQDAESEKSDRQKLSTISVLAKKSDLEAYRSGKIGEDTFRKRLDISRAEAHEKNLMDLKVMAKILETAFKDADEKSFRVSGSVDYLKLDNFGALFSFDARYSNGNLFLEKLAPSADSEAKMVQIFAAEKKARQGKKNEDQSLDKKEAERKQKTVKAYKDFVNQLKEYLVDYGRTLKSVDSDQRILVSVNFSSRYEEVPERVDIQIRKSTLDAMDRGKLNRDQAISKIQLREY